MLRIYKDYLHDIKTATGHTPAQKNPRKVRYIQPMTLSGSKMRPVRDESTRDSIPIVDWTSGVPHSEIQILYLCTVRGGKPSPPLRLKPKKDITRDLAAMDETWQVCFLLIQDVTRQSKQPTQSENITYITLLKGIVSWDWDWLEWIVNERSKGLRVAGAYFYCFLMPFSCFNL